jgi:hypothetical protein
MSIETSPSSNTKNKKPHNFNLLINKGGVSVERLCGWKVTVRHLFRHTYKRVKNYHAYIKSGINMTEQPNEQNNPQKLLIDNPQNFQFHAAYLVYGEAFDKARDNQAKTELNQNIQNLSENKISMETFYMNISRFRKIDAPRQERFSMQTQRKKDWRKKEQRQDRIKRHKK